MIDWVCPHNNRFCGQPGWSKCGACHDDLKPTADPRIATIRMDIRCTGQQPEPSTPSPANATGNSTLR